MKKWMGYAIIIVLAAGAFIFLSQLPSKPAEKTGETAQFPSEARVSKFCANFTDASKCDSAVMLWEGKAKGSEAYAVIDYQPDGKSAFKEGWIIYMRLSQPLPIPGTNRSTMRIGILADKNSNSSQIYEFVE